MAADRTVIVTGGNSGLGYECAKAILNERRGWHVVIAGRSQTRCQDAAKRLAAETSNEGVEAKVLDLASLASVRRFAESMKAASVPPLRALVCNAGIQVVGETQTTADGFEATFAVNHLAHFLLAHLLLRQLEAPGRVIFVSSGTHDPTQKTGMPAPEYLGGRALAFPPESPREGPGFAGRKRYTTSKLCNVLCAYEFDRRLRAEGLSTPARPLDVNAFDPGLMPGTGLARDYGPLIRFLWFKLGPSLRPLLKLMSGNVYSADQSGRALAQLVLDPELQGRSGRYFEVGGEARSSVESYDLSKAADLWERSVELVGLRPEETLLNPSHSVTH